MTRYLMAALCLLAAFAPTAQARKLNCASGATQFVDGKVRVFAKPYRSAFTNGWIDYACRGRGGRPLRVSDDLDWAGESETTTWRYAVAGGRYLAVASEHVEDAETGSYSVYDLETRREITAVDAVWDFGHLPQVRLSPHGELLAVNAENQLEAIAPGGKHSTLSKAASRLALAGTTAYWTEGGAAHSAALAGAPSQAQDGMFGPAAYYGHSACELRPGTTLFRDLHVRVARHGKKLFACRVPGKQPSFELPSHTTAFTVANQRWLFGVDTCSHSGMVFDTRFGFMATALEFDRRWPHTLLDDGTLVWIHKGLFARRLAADEDTKLADDASALASTGMTVYWTQGGAAHSWQAAPHTPGPTAGSWATCA